MTQALLHGADEQHCCQHHQAGAEEVEADCALAITPAGQQSSRGQSLSGLKQGFAVVSLVGCRQAGAEEVQADCALAATPANNSKKNQQKKSVCWSTWLAFEWAVAL
jgi:hypothetical protein